MSRKIAVLCIFVLCGCDSPSSTIPIHALDLPRGGVVFGGDSVDGQPGIDFGSIRFAGKRFIVWSDGREGIPKYGGGTLEGHIDSRRPGSIECSYEVPVTGTGNATIDGKTYKMADGNLFLVSLGRSSIRVQQLQRDLPNVELKLNADNGSALKLAMRDDSDFKEFFRDHATVADEIK